MAEREQRRLEISTQHVEGICRFGQECPIIKSQNQLRGKTINEAQHILEEALGVPPNSLKIEIDENMSISGILNAHCRSGNLQPGQDSCGSIHIEEKRDIFSTQTNPETFRTPFERFVAKSTGRKI